MPSFTFWRVQVPPLSGDRHLMFCDRDGRWSHWGGGVGMRRCLPSSRSLARPGSAPVDRTKSDRTASISRVMWSCRRAAQHSAEVGVGSRLETIHLRREGRGRGHAWLCTWGHMQWPSGHSIIESNSNIISLDSHVREGAMVKSSTADPTFCQLSW